MEVVGNKGEVALEVTERSRMLRGESVCNEAGGHWNHGKIHEEGGVQRASAIGRALWRDNAEGKVARRFYAGVDPRQVFRPVLHARLMTAQTSDEGHPDGIPIA